MNPPIREVGLAAGATVREAAKRFGMLIASAVRIGQLERAGRGLAAHKIGGNRLPSPLLVCEAITARLGRRPEG